MWRQRGAKSALLVSASFTSSSFTSSLWLSLGRGMTTKSNQQQQQQSLASTFRKITSGRTKRGLYHGKHVMHGDKVSENGKNRTKRTWKPNSSRKRLYSEILNDMVSVLVTTKTLRCVDKAGGLDAYILNGKDESLRSVGAMQLREKLLKAKELQEERRRKEEGERMGGGEEGE